MADRRHDELANPSAVDRPPDDIETVLTTPEDVASAGRSCMVIVVLGAVIVLLIVVWAVYGAYSGQ